MLSSLAVQGPGVVVGHGTGCLHSRVFAAESCSGGGDYAVQGMVLVEPSVEGTTSRHAALGIANGPANGTGAEEESRGSRARPSATWW